MRDKLKTFVKNYRLFFICYLVTNGFNSYSQVVEPPQVRYVCVDSDVVTLRWAGSVTPGVTYYTIWYGSEQLEGSDLSYKQILGTYPATALNDYTITFNVNILPGDANPQNKPIVFAVQAMINDSVYSPADDKFRDLKWDSTLYLTANFDTCLALVTLNWNDYDFNMWPGGNLSYRIYMQENSGNYSLLDEISNTQTTYEVNNLVANNTYRFYIASMSADNPGDSATSTLAEINTSVAALPAYLYANFATNENNSIKLSFSIDPAGELKTYDILRSNRPNGEYLAITRINTFDNNIEYTDNANYLSGPYYYKLQAINYCNVPIRESENLASTILLNVSGEAIEPQLSWNDYVNWINGVANYTIERAFNNNYEQLASTTNLNYIDSDLQNYLGTSAGSEVCYRVTATELNNIFNNNASSLSNTVCVELPVNMRFEYDAFVPGSPDNGSFGPAMDFLPKEFEFEILDRNGRVVFSTTDATNPRWNGLINNKIAPQGAYLYVVKYNTGGRKSHVLRGGVMVINP